MCTVKELKEYLNSLPDDMEVEVPKQCYKSYDVYTTWVSLDIEKFSDNCNVYNDTLYFGED
jgi:hypothetical protein